MKQFFRSASLLLSISLLLQGLCVAAPSGIEVSRLTFQYPNEDAVRIDLTISQPVAAYTIIKALDRTTIDIPGVKSSLYSAYTVRNSFDVQVETSSLNILGAPALRLTVISPRGTVVEHVDDPVRMSFLVRSGPGVTTKGEIPTSAKVRTGPLRSGPAALHPRTAQAPKSETPVGSAYRKVMAIVPAPSATPAGATTGTAGSKPATGDKVRLSGRVRDENGAVIVGAEVTVKTADKQLKTVRTDADGLYTFADLPPGKYTITVRAQNFADHISQTVDVTRVPHALVDVVLKVNDIKAEVVTVAQDSGLSSELDNNANGVVLKPQDLSKMPDDPQGFSVALRALAAASGSMGGEVIVDGFVGGRIPPKKAIKEIRISKNTYSAEYSRPGNGRIEIITKPGMEEFSGGGYLGYNSRWMNTRDPLAVAPLPYNNRDHGFYFGGPIIPKRVSFFSNYDGTVSTSVSSIEARVLDAGLNVVPLEQSFSTPQRNRNLATRFDVQLDPRNTFIAKYIYSGANGRNVGIGGTSLADRAYNTRNTEQTLQFSETSVISPTVVTETRSQYSRRDSSRFGVNFGLTIDVPGAFTSGLPFSNARSIANRLDIHNVTTATRGKHTLRGGAGFRYLDLFDQSDRGFGGTYRFDGGLAAAIDSSGRIILDANGKPVFENVTGLERYRRTLLLSRLGILPGQIRSLGGGASQFSLTRGDTAIGISQISFYGFVQDEWRVRPNFTIGLGARIEGQNNVPHGRTIAPRVSFAWSKKSSKNGKVTDQPTIVVRGGTGLFYESFGENFTLRGQRSLKGQRQYIATDPTTLDAFPSVPTEESLRSASVPSSTITTDPAMRLPIMLQSNIGVEKQLRKKVVFSAIYTNIRTFHSLRSRSIDPIARRFQYESTGRFGQNQLSLTLSRRLSRASVYATYNLIKATDSTDGPDFIALDRSDLGRSSSDVRHSVYVGGWLKALGVDISPTLVYRSGMPFNITEGRDLNGDTVLNDRPAFATDLTRPSVVSTPYGVFDTDPMPGQQIIPRNYGTSSPFWALNLNLSRTFTLGGENAGDDKSHQMFGITMPARPVYLTFSVQVENLLNRANPYIPEGNLSSPLFGRSYTSSGAYGFGAYQPGNRVIKPYITFSF